MIQDETLSSKTINHFSCQKRSKLRYVLGLLSANAKVYPLIGFSVMPIVEDGLCFP